MHHEWLKGKARRGSKVFDIFDAWIASTADICEKFWDYSEGEFFPFHDNEASAVSILLAGAARCSYLPVSEYRLRKRSWQDRRRWKDGRADLWFVADDEAFSFEFKRSWDAANQKNLGEVLDLAKADIRRIPTSEYDYAYAGVIAPVYEEAEPMVYESYADKVDFVCKIGDPDRFEVFLYFDQRKDK